MKNKFSKLIAVIFTVVVLFSLSVDVFAESTPGTVLQNPESGWTRYSFTNKYIKFNGDYWEENAGSDLISLENNASISFNFNGTKLRLIGFSYSNRADASIKIDGIDYGTYKDNYTVNGSWVYDTLLFEKTGLQPGIHSVEINRATTPGYLELRAVDIDNTGYLVDNNIPINVFATAGDKTVTLNWSAVNGSTGYNIKRTAVTGGPYSTIASNFTGTTYLDTTVDNGTTYYYVISGLSGSVESENSYEVSATPQPAKPSAPINLSTIPGESGVTLTWDAVDGATVYNVKWGTVAGNYTNSQTVSNETYYDVTGLTNGTTYYFTVSALNSAGESANSAEVSATPQATVPSAPINLAATPGDTKVTLKWDAVDGATLYNVKWGTTSGNYTNNQKVSNTTFDVAGLINGTTYYFAVSALNDMAEGVNTNETAATPITSNSIKLKLVLEVNEEKHLSVSEDLSDNTGMTWASSETSIAAVDVNGMVKALKPGNTVITSTSKDGSYSETINVLVVDLSYQLAVDLKVGETCRLTVDDLANATNVTWTAYDTSIASVSSKGKVTAVKQGLTYVTATDANGKEIGRIYIRVRN